MGTPLPAVRGRSSATGATGKKGRPEVPVRLFGQFLVDHGVLDQEDLSDALSLMKVANVTMGDLAVERGLVTRHEAEEIHRLQRCIDGKWGEIALTLGIGNLTAEAIEELRWEQESQNLRLTDALVQLGLLTSTEVDGWLATFEAEQLSTNIAYVPSAWENSAAQYVLDVLPRLLPRVLQSPVRFGLPRFWDAKPFACQALGTLETPREKLTVGMTVELKVAEHIAQRLAQPSKPMTPSHHLADFLTLVLEHVVRRVESEAASPPPPLDPVHANRLPRRGVAFDLAVSSGRAILVIDRNDPEQD